MVSGLCGQSTSELRQRGLRALQSGQFTVAERLFSQLVKVDPSDTAFNDLTRAQFAMGNAGKALETVDAAAKALPDDSHLLVALARLCLAYEQPQKARELLEDAVEVAPRDNRLKLLLAATSLKAEEPVETLAVLQNVPSNAGAPGQVMFLRGSAFMLTGKLKRAASLIASALAADSVNVAYLSTYAELESLQKNYGGALITLRQAEHLQPRNPTLCYKIALVCVFMHKYADAETACKKATALAPQFDQAYFLLGAVQLERGVAATALDAFHRAAVLNPASPLYHSALGAALFETGQFARSQSELDHALLLSSRTASAYYWRGRLRVSQGKRKKAIQDLEDFVALDPNYPDAYQRLAQLYAAEGQGSKASAAKAEYASLTDKAGQNSVPFFLLRLEINRLRQTRKVSY